MKFWYGINDADDAILIGMGIIGLIVLGYSLLTMLSNYLGKRRPS